MKQHITKEQWSELSKKAQASILIKIKFIVPTTICDGLTGFEYMFIGIGQMMEYLGDDFWDINKEGKEWTVVIYIHHEITKGELCDALWEAVKYKLKDND